MALDPSYFFYSDGTITLTNGSDIATGTMVAWDPAVLPFDFVFPQNGTAGMAVIAEVLAVNQIRLATEWTGPNLTDVPYFMVRWANHIDPRFYAIRVSEYLTRIRDMPATGPNGWAPVPVPVDDGERSVLQIADWVGGYGTKPATGGYLGPTGIVSDISQATDIRGPQGEDSTVPGPPGDKGWSPVYAIVADGARRVKQLVDYVGGEGAKPTVPANTYVGPTGYTTDIAQATDERGPAGPAVGANSVDNTLLADMPANTLKGNNTGASSDPKDLTVAQAKAMLGIGISMAKAPPEIAYVNATTITVKAGKCRDEDDTTDLINPANFNITLAGAPVSAHRHVLFGYDGSGNPAASFSTTIALPAGWQAYRRIGSIRTDASGQIRSFIQLGDRFDFLSPVKDVSDSAQSTAGTLRTLSVPVDVQVEAILNVRAVKVNSQVAVHVYPSSLSDPTLTLAGAAAGTGGVDPSLSGFAGTSGTTSAGATQLRVPTNTLGQVKSISSVATTILEITTMGWIDRRGRDK